MAGDGDQSFPCKEPGCNGTVTYRRTVVKVYRSKPETESDGRIIRVHLECEPNRHKHEYAVFVRRPTRHDRGNA